MTVRYNLTSTCLSSGTMALTRSLRDQLSGRSDVSMVDEEGEAFDIRVNWERGLLEGLGSYYAKRRLGVNETLLLHIEPNGINLEVPNARPPRPKPLAAAPTEPLTVEPPPPPPSREKRVRVTPYPKEVIYPQSPVVGELPSFVADLEKLGLHRESGGPPWRFRASLGRRAFQVALSRLAEANPTELLALRQQGVVQFAAVVITEIQREEVQRSLEAGIALVTTEALQKLVKLKTLFPVGLLDLERLLKTGRVDAAGIQALERDVTQLLGERAAFSAVLMCLAELSPQQVFMLADLSSSTAEMGIEPAKVQHALEVLSGPPFLLLKRLSPGEFLLREPVNKALTDLAEYARFVGTRLMVAVS